MKNNRQLLLILLPLISTGVFAQSDTVKPVKPTGFDRKSQFGLALGAGTSRFRVTNSNWKQGAVNYADSLKSVGSNSVFKFDLTIIYLVNFNKTVSLRPAATLSFEGGKVEYSKQQSTETVNLNTVSEMVSLPLLFKFRNKNVQPYFAIGPSFLFMLGQDKKAENLLPLKTFDVLGDGAIGLDIDAPKWKIIVTPEIKYSAGVLNQKGTANNLYSNTVESLKRQSFTFTIYFRDR
jgi:hypothetical protein